MVCFVSSIKTRGNWVTLFFPLLWKTDVYNFSVLVNPWGRALCGMFHCHLLLPA